MNDTVVTNSVKRFKWVGTRPIRPDGVPKVTGRAMYGARLQAAWHAVRQDPALAARARAHPLDRHVGGREAARRQGGDHGKDLPDQKFDYIGPERVAVNFWHVTRNIMAREKALYEGHAVAAVAAISASIAEEACALIKIDYEVLPHVIDVDEAMQPDAPLLFEDMITRGVEPAPTKPSNISKRLEFTIGDVEAGFAQADVVIEKEFKTAAVHQAYIEPHACLARCDADGQTEIWSSSQGHFQMRALTAQILQKPIGDIRVYPAEIGGGFGGKTVTYLEPVATMLSMKSGSPVRLMMSARGRVPRHRPDLGLVDVGEDRRHQGRQDPRRRRRVQVPGRRLPRLAGDERLPVRVRAVRHPEPALGRLRRGVQPPEVGGVSRARLADLRLRGGERARHAARQKIGMDPLELRHKNAARPARRPSSGRSTRMTATSQTIEALQNHPAYKVKLGKNQGRGVASGYWFNGGGDSSATIQVNADGTVLVATGSPDIGGSRASMAIMAAETLGVDYNQVRAIVADTGSVGYTHVTGGSRVTFATGTAVVNATKAVVKDLCKRAALIWDVDPDGVIWEDGFAKPAGSNVGDFEPLSLKALAAKSSATGGPITAAASVNAGGQAPGFSTQFCDVEVDPETGKVTILRFVAAQDVGKAIHPSYVEGQIQGGVVQGIGWALNEEYIYNAKGQLDNPGFLDYRCPVASDLPMIDAVLVEVPNPAHPYGAKGVGEVNICPPMAAIANAIDHAIGCRMTELPMSPPKVLAALDAKGA